MRALCFRAAVLVVTLALRHVLADAEPDCAVGQAPVRPFSAGTASGAGPSSLLHPCRYPIASTSPAVALSLALAGPVLQKNASSTYKLPTHVLLISYCTARNPSLPFRALPGPSVAKAMFGSTYLSIYAIYARFSFRSHLITSAPGFTPAAFNM